MPKVTFKGQIPIDVEKRIHLSTNDGLTGYRINKFQIMSSDPGNGSHELVGKIRLTEDANVGPTVNLNDPDVIAACYHTDLGNANVATSDSIILDQETFNQDIFVQIGDAMGGTSPANFYIELEKIKLNINSAAFHTLKNIRSNFQ